jgi:hypothetical protein
MAYPYLYSLMVRSNAQSPFRFDRNFEEDLYGAIAKAREIHKIDPEHVTTKVVRANGTIRWLSTIHT